MFSIALHVWVRRYISSICISRLIFNQLAKVDGGAPSRYYQQCVQLLIIASNPDSAGQSRDKYRVYFAALLATEHPYSATTAIMYVSFHTSESAWFGQNVSHLIILFTYAYLDFPCRTLVISGLVRYDKTNLFLKS